VASKPRVNLPKDLEKKKLPPEVDIADPLEAEIAKRISAIVSKGQKDEVLAQVVSVVREERFSGPIAHPRHLREYEEICPGAADRIISMAEQELSSQREIAKTIVDAEVKNRHFGMWAGLLAFGFLVSGAIVSVIFNQNVLAFFFLSAAAIGVVGKFIDGRRSDLNGEDEKPSRN
jgi:uncharacterized membrane protein